MGSAADAAQSMNIILEDIKENSMAMAEKECRKVSIAEAVEISKSNPNAEVCWRPEKNLPEEQQYALVANE